MNSQPRDFLPNCNLPSETSKTMNKHMSKKLHEHSHDNKCGKQPANVNKPSAKRSRGKNGSMKRIIKQKLYWDMSQLAFLISKKPFPNSQYDQMIRAVDRLGRKLLRVGGDSVCVDFGESPAFCEVITKHGTAFHDSEIQMQPGKPCECHWNVARLWKGHKAEYLIFTGFGLSQDNMWRRHSWLLTKDATIIETTVVRKAYFGVCHNLEAAELFCASCGV